MSFLSKGKANIEEHAAAEQMAYGQVIGGEDDPLA